MVNIKINNKELNVLKDLTILQAASLAEIQIPRFCYHEKLTIAGNCRMCLVEMEKVNKPVASCALPVSEGMQIYTNSNLVKKAREGVLELLLANHPLDCPICDQGGECDLQDQALIFGNDRSRFYEIKRAVSDKTISPFIKTIMTRCIHCTRCVRFLNEVAGVHELGMTGRGSVSEIGTYIENTISSELSGNIIDLCPVGALTSKPYAFTARPWELRSVETIDLFDSLGTNIKIDTRGSNLMRILPKINESLNEEWITDKTRFSFDGYKLQRLNIPLISQEIKYQFSFRMPIFFKSKTKVKFTKIILLELIKYFLNSSWLNAFLVFKEFYFLHLKHNSSLNIVLGDQLNNQTIELCKLIKKQLHFSNILNQSSFDFNLYNRNKYDFQSDYILNLTPQSLEKIDVCLLIGVNLRLENPLLNSRLRKAFLINNAQIYSIGPQINALYNLKKLGNSFSTLANICAGKNSFCSVLQNAKNPLILLGNHFSSEISNLKSYLIKQLKNFNFNIMNMNVIHIDISSNIKKELNSDNLLRLNINKLNSNSINYFFTYLIQTDEIFFSSDLQNTNFKHFMVYQGYHGDRLAIESDIIFPTAAPFEETGNYYNILNKIIQTNMCITSLNSTRTSWKIIYALYLFLSNYNDKTKLNNLLSLTRVLNFKLNNRLTYFIKYNNLTLLENNKIQSLEMFLFPNILLNNIISNYFKTNTVSRISKVMSQATKLQRKLIKI